MNHDNSQTPDDKPLAPEWMERLLARGAEPYWMADIRLAQRKIDARRLRRAEGRSEGQGGEGNESP
jgi:hypothetical protein